MLWVWFENRDMIVVSPINTVSDNYDSPNMTSCDNTAMVS